MSNKFLTYQEANEHLEYDGVIDNGDTDDSLYIFIEHGMVTKQIRYEAVVKCLTAMRNLDYDDYEPALIDAVDTIINGAPTMQCFEELGDDSEYAFKFIDMSNPKFEGSECMPVWRIDL